MSRIVDEKDTCTACGGTMIMEFAALSRLTGDSIYEVWDIPRGGSNSLGVWYICACENTEGDL